ncbi:TonB-dependent receptor [Rugamonas rivuli]|uniref:TonB-dependent receptor n=1 Tax=Rugamonas rivuli TaxID=2743358 RepID=A0A843SDC8_9BURK|nr:TonB-dependent receptor [Rugamonas rivuli]MQA18687.1 TonB-dependent receptor [Rugamonas rivuli]
MRYTKELCGTMAALGLAVTAQAQQSDDQGDTARVVVTAQKREQLLQDVPVSVSAINSDSLKSAKIDTGTEIARQVANLRVSVLGDESQPKFSLRGISTPEFNLNAISPTGIFFDEVYVGAPFLGGAQIFDVERVEVLRGPQGTLFGKNTTAGAVNFISKKPTFRQNGDLTVGYGSHNLKEAKGAIEVPLIEDRLSARFAFTAAHSDGYIENVNPAGHDLSNIDRKAARLTLAYKDGDGWNGTLRLFGVNNNPEAVGAVNEGSGPGGLNANGRNPRINPYTGQPLSLHQVATDRSGVIEVRGSGGYLTINKNTDLGTFTSITSYVDGRFYNLVDADGTIDPLLHIDFSSKTREISQDLRFTTALDGPLQLIAGLYHQRDDIDIGTTYTIFGGPPVLPILRQSYNQGRRSYAAYADGTYELSKILTLYGGLRYTRDEGRLNNFKVDPVIPQQGQLSYNDGKPTGRIGMSAQLDKDVMVFGHYARGYRSSAFNGGTLTNVADLNVAKPEDLNSFEAGIKTQLFDRKLTLNASAFLYNFKNQQFLNVVGIGTQQLVNAGSSRITGTEIEAIYVPTRSLRLSAGVGLLNASYRELLINGVDLSGKRMIEAPRYTANAAADYRVAAGAWSLNFHADATLVGEQYFIAANTQPSRVGQSRDVAARVSLTSPSKKYEYAIYGKNLTDNQVATGIVLDPTSATRFTTMPYPRRYGIEASVRF